LTCEEGEAGLVDRRLGKASGRRVPADRAEEVERLYRERYHGFTVKHFHEHLIKDHGFGWGYTWLKLHLQWAGVVPKAPRKGAHRRKRERRPLRGMMLHQDGSRHEWLEGQALDLIVTLDDATGAIYSAFLVEEEGTASTFRALNEVFSEQGLPMSLYTDRGAHYFHTPKAGGEVDRGHPTQVGRALEQLGVEHIGAFSPQARGRSERAFGTLQDRLPKELRLAGLSARRRHRGQHGQASGLPTPPTRQHKTRRSGHLMRYQNRTSSFAIDRGREPMCVQTLTPLKVIAPRGLNLHREVLPAITVFTPVILIVLLFDERMSPVAMPSSRP
jgi:hypothetical protein